MRPDSRIQSHDEGIVAGGTDPAGELLCLFDGGGLTDEDAPLRRVRIAREQASGAEPAFHFLAELLGVIADAKDTDLDGEEFGGGSENFGSADHFETNVCQTGTDHLNFSSGGAGEIDDAAADERTAIRDANIDAFSVVEIVNAEPGSEGEGAMSGGKFFHVVDFAVGRAAAVIRMTVPACDTVLGGSDARRDGFRRFFFAAGEQGNGSEEEQRGKKKAMLGGHVKMGSGTHFVDKTILPLNVFGARDPFAPGRRSAR
jgi:hypothetical protein